MTTSARKGLGRASSLRASGVPASGRRLMAALLAAGVATFADLYAVQGVLPALARDFAVSPTDAALSVSAATAGLALTVLPWASVADRIGRLRSMRIAVLAAAAIAVAAALAPTFEVFLVLRFLGGAALGAVPALAVAYIHEHLSDRAAVAAAAAYISGTTIGGAAGRLLAGPLAGFWGWRPALVAVAVISCLAAVAFVVLATDRPLDRRAPVSRDAGWRWKVAAALRDRVLLALYVQSFLLVGVFVAVYNYLAFRLEAPPFGLAPALASLIFVTYLAGTASARLASSLAARVGPHTVILAGLVAMLFGIGLLAVDGLPLLLAGLVLFTAGFFGCHAMATAWTGARADPAWRSQASALYTIAFYAGSATGGWALGIVFQRSGWIALTLWVAAVLVVVALVTLAGLRGARARPRT